MQNLFDYTKLEQAEASGLIIEKWTDGARTRGIQWTEKSKDEKFYRPNTFYRIKA